MHKWNYLRISEVCPSTGKWIMAIYRYLRRRMELNEYVFLQCCYPSRSYQKLATLKIFLFVDQFNSHCFFSFHDRLINTFPASLPWNWTIREFHSTRPPHDTSLLLLIQTRFTSPSRTHPHQLPGLQSALATAKSFSGQDVTTICSQRPQSQVQSTQVVPLVDMTTLAIYLGHWQDFLNKA